MADKHNIIITPIDSGKKSISYVTTRTNADDPIRNTEVSSKHVQLGDNYGISELEVHIGEQFDKLDADAAKTKEKEAALATIITNAQTRINNFLDTRND
jgi:hypothetical protein